jgi:hypothetical protein
MAVYSGVAYSRLKAINLEADTATLTAVTGTLTGNVDATAGYIQLRTATAAQIADIANAINTAGKAAGTVAFDTTNSKIKVATGANANSTWVDADGTNAVTPS